jgi:diguanylate cyclase (GGDEF)-like protein
MSSPTSTPTSEQPNSFERRLALASTAMSLGQHAACSQACQALYADAQAAGDANMAAEAAVLLAKDFSNAQDLTQCMHWAELGLQSAVACQAPQLQAVAWVVMSSTNARLQEPVKSVVGIQQALALLDDGMTVEVQRSVFTGIGLSYMSLGMPLQALVTLEKASAIVQAAGNPSQRARARVNVLFAIVASYDLLVSLDAPRAAKLLADAQGECDRLKADAQLAGNSHAWASYCHAAGMVLYRVGDLPQARTSFEEVLKVDAEMPDVVQQAVLVRLGRVLMAQGEAAQALACAKKANALRRSEDDTLRLAEDLLQASELAELMGDPTAALALYKRYHARVVRNEQAAFDARVADLSATVAAQSMRLEISDLQARNAGLSSTFKQLNDLALTDALTSAANRRGLEQAFTGLRANDQTVVLAMMDLDHFKQVNDRFSHGVGDQVLRDAARLMAESLRDRDFLGRYGGEEFTALLVDTALPEAVLVAERLRERVQAFDWVSIADGLAVTISVGVVTVRAGEGFAEAVARADVLLYAAKAQGRNRVLAEGFQTDGV